MSSGYADVSGLRLYYEIHGEGRPLVLLHGALSGIRSSFGAYVDELAKSHRVIGLEMQAHAHTADIDRPLRIKSMAADTIAALEQLGVAQADLFGYSMGAGVAFQVAQDRPDLVRKVVLMSLSLDESGFHPGALDQLAQLQPEWLVGSPWQQDYAASAPNPDDFPALVAKVKDMNANLPRWSDEEIRSLEPPALLLSGDSDVVLEHLVRVFRLLGGGISGDTPAGLAKSRLAVLPATSHTMMVDRAEVLLPMLRDFLAAD
jgi:pimeloyl-ACP methyl ester carboxylesterase